MGKCWIVEETDFMSLESRIHILRGKLTEYHENPMGEIKTVYEKYKKYEGIIYSTPSREMWQAIKKAVEAK